METGDITVKWKWLKSQLELVRDEDLRKVMMVELRKRAFEEWGFDPQTTKINSEKKIGLDDWEKEFVKDIRKANIYEIDTRVGKREREAKLAKANMCCFIERGGQWKDLPKELQNKHILKLYLDTFIEIIDDDLKTLENL